MERCDLIEWICSSKDNTELAERYDKWAASYDADLDEAFGWIGPEMAVKAFSRLVSKNARVLDAGAGTGLVGQALSARGFTHIVAADLSKGMLTQARKKGVYCAFYQIVMGEALEFKSNSFDAVISVGALTLGHAPPSAFDELIRITKPGGHIVVTLRTDVYEGKGFKQKQRTLEAESKWGLSEVSQPFQPLPKGAPDVFHQVWAYQVL